MNQKDIKLLWGRSGNRCAICKAELTQNKEAVSASYTLGEQAHIVGEKNSAARGESLLDESERDGYHNRILLCPNDHSEVDSNEEDWPVERLHKMKSEHEIWVNETLSETTDRVLSAKQLAVANVIDATVSLCRLEDWDSWADAAASSIPQWPLDIAENRWRIRNLVQRAVWPEEFDELKRATNSFSILLNLAYREFRKHSRPDYDGQSLTTDPFYKSNGFNENYWQDLEAYESWIDKCQHFMREVAKAANWFADTVRRDVNPTFFASQGKFLLTAWEVEDFDDNFILLEFTEVEKDKLPEALSDLRVHP